MPIQPSPDKMSEWGIWAPFKHDLQNMVVKQVQKREQVAGET